MFKPSWVSKKNHRWMKNFPHVFTSPFSTPERGIFPILPPNRPEKIAGIRKLEEWDRDWAPHFRFGDFGKLPFWGGVLEEVFFFLRKRGKTGFVVPFFVDGKPFFWIPTLDLIKAGCWFNDQSTYPHVRYPHEKQSLSKGLLTIGVPLVRPY